MGKLKEVEGTITELFISQIKNEYKDFINFLEEAGISLLPTGFEFQCWFDNKPITEDELYCKYRLWKKNKIL